jgi:hypothetical protein
MFSSSCSYRPFGQPYPFLFRDGRQDTQNRIAKNTAAIQIRLTEASPSDAMGRQPL